MRKCWLCHKLININELTASRNSAHRICYNTYRRNLYHKNDEYKQRVKQKNRKYYENHKEYHNKKTKEWDINHPVRRKEIWLKSYEKNKEKIKERSKVWAKTKRKEMKREIYSLLKNKCAICGITDILVLQIDHIKGGGLQQRKLIGGNDIKYYKNILKEIKEGRNKYQLLCANCNWRKRTENGESEIIR